MPLSHEHLLDELAIAYVQVVAAMAGAAIAVSRSDYGVYGTLCHVVQSGEKGLQEYKFIPGGFAVEFQVKGTAAAMMNKDFVAYDLNVRNYDLIVARSPFSPPLYLFLVCFDSEPENWIALQKEQIILTASAYWWKRSGAPTTNSSTVRIEVPVASWLTPNALQYMLEGSKNWFAKIELCPSSQTARTVSTTELAKYLQSTGWAVRPSDVKGVSVFSKTVLGVDEPVHIWLPKLQGVGEDYRRIADALRTIAAVEERPILTIVDQISGNLNKGKEAADSNVGQEAIVEPMLTEIEADRKFDVASETKAQPPVGDDPPRTVTVRLTVNGTSHTLSLDPRSSLLDVLRELLALTGTKKGCDHGQCGACTVHLDGRCVVSCLMPAVQVDGRQVTTIEGLSPPGGDLHPMQQAFIDYDALQCGYCTPGQIMAAVSCVSEGHASSPDQIREYMSGNICRCGAYVGIVAAVEHSALKMRNA